MGNEQSTTTEATMKSETSVELYNTCIQEYSQNVESYVDASNTIDFSNGKIVVSGTGNDVSVVVNQIASVASQIAASDVLQTVVDSDLDAESTAEVLSALYTSAEQEGGILSDQGSDTSSEVDLSTSTYAEQYSKISQAVSYIMNTCANNVTNLSGLEVDVSGEKNSLNLDFDQRAEAVNEMLSETYNTLGVDTSSSSASDTTTDTTTDTTNTQEGTISSVSDDIGSTVSNIADSITSFASTYPIVIAIVIIIIILLIFSPFIIKAMKKKQTAVTGGEIELNDEEIDLSKKPLVGGDKKKKVSKKGKKKGNSKKGKKKAKK